MESVKCYWFHKPTHAGTMLLRGFVTDNPDLPITFAKISILWSKFRILPKPTERRML